MVNKDYQKHKFSEKKPTKDTKIFLKKRKIKDEKSPETNMKIFPKKKKQKLLVCMKKYYLAQKK